MLYQLQLAHNRSQSQGAKKLGTNITKKLFFANSPGVEAIDTAPAGNGLVPNIHVLVGAGNAVDVQTMSRAEDSLTVSTAPSAGVEIIGMTGRFQTPHGIYRSSRSSSAV